MTKTEIIHEVNINEKKPLKRFMIIYENRSCCSWWFPTWSWYEFDICFFGIHKYLFFLGRGRFNRGGPFYNQPQGYRPYSNYMHFYGPPNGYYADSYHGFHNYENQEGTNGHQQPARRGRGRRHRQNTKNEKYMSMILLSLFSNDCI